ncbi:uncharacterized protein LOC118809634 [Colossoma macropomum]|uniref:uncharacterized protein LOC118809634 n=1 Tax=Colossoma macropomum TaxID=42526 RepID=UPI001863F1A9|nr:uncharacterized protein LOC118809634 [Colossoma macropomum]
MCLSLFLGLVFAVGCEGLHVQGPPDPLVAQLGDTVLLPCFSQNSLPLEDLQVEWRRTDSLVITFQQGETRPELQSESFQGRVHFFPDEISKGNFSILINHLVKKDAGIYRCKVNTGQDSGETEVELKDIEYLVVKGANHPISASVGEEVILNCSVDFHVPATEIEEVSWKRTDPEIPILLYQDNEVLSDYSHESYQGRVEFFHSEISKGNFSLKLKDIKMEDKGEFMCEVHVGHLSAHTFVVLQSLGFSVFHILILVLCVVALLLAVGLCIPIFILLRKKATSGKAMKMHASLVLFPNICMCAAFILWSTEGYLTEIVTCSTVSIIRPLMLLKTFPYLNRLPKRLTKAVKTLAVPVYHSVIILAACSLFSGQISQVQTANNHILTVMVVLGGICFIIAAVLAGCAFQMHSAVVLQLCNAALLGFILSNQSTENFEYSIQIPSVLAPMILGNMMVLSLQRHYFQGKPFKRSHIVLSSVILTLISVTEVSLYVLISITTMNITTAWILPFEVLIQVIAWLSVLCMLRCTCSRQGCCSQQRGIGYLCCTVLAATLTIAFGTVCIHYISMHMKNKKDCGGYMALTALIHVLAATSFFKHPKDLPDFLHILIYMFGAVVLNIVNSMALAAELCLKAGNGVRAVEDLRVIILPFETVFASGWLTLQVYHVWIRIRHRITQNFEDQTEREPQVLPEMDILTASELKPSDPSEDDPLS